VNIKCFYAKSTCLGSNYRNINSLTLVQKVIPGYLQRTLDNYNRPSLPVAYYHDLSHGVPLMSVNCCGLKNLSNQCPTNYVSNACWLPVQQIRHLKYIFMLGCLEPRNKISGRGLGCSKQDKLLTWQ
jgi:hypothetical protein